MKAQKLTEELLVLGLEFETRGGKNFLHGSLQGVDVKIRFSETGVLVDTGSPIELVDNTRIDWQSAPIVGERLILDNYPTIDNIYEVIGGSNE